MKGELIMIKKKFNANEQMVKWMNGIDKLGKLKMKQNKYVLVFATEDSIQLNVNQNINRPNQPDDYELIAEYAEDNYGAKVYEIVALDDIEKITI